MIGSKFFGSDGGGEGAEDALARMERREAGRPDSPCPGRRKARHTMDCTALPRDDRRIEAVNVSTIVGGERFSFFEGETILCRPLTEFPLLGFSQRVAQLV